jgi:signal transduction histidine kinase
MRLPNIRWRRVYHSIIVRVILLSIFGVVLANTARGYFSLKILRSDITSATSTQQLMIAQDLAADISHKIALRQAVLQPLGQSVSAHTLADAAALNVWLRAQQTVLSPLFNALAVVRADGSVVATYPTELQAFVATQGHGTNRVHLGTIGSTPVLALTAALPQMAGDRGMELRGVVRLAVPGLLDAVLDHRNGERGENGLVFRDEQQVLNLSESMIRLQPIPKQEGIGLFALASAGALPPGPIMDSRGEEVIAAASPVPGQAWSVVTSMPTAQAYLPVFSKSKLYFHSIPFVVPLLVLYSTVVAFYVLRPLGRAARLANQMSRGDIPLGRLPVVKPDEIGALTAAFNRLLDRLDAQSKELSKQKELAESAALAKSRFLAAASHDLRQPMHALNLYLGALDHFELPLAARPVMNSARECAETMDEMFRALLDISKLDASTMRANVRVFALGPLLEKIKVGYIQQARAKGLELRVAPCTAWVASDPELLERVLSNLVSNAVRYTERGKVLLGCRRTATGMRIGVYDTGPGIAPEQQRAVFEEFFQVNNPQRDRAQGLGLGLAIVQRLCGLLQAPLSLRSTLGQGAVFCLEVTRAKPQGVVDSMAAVSVQGTHGTLDGALIVVIDDEASILDATALLLRQWGCTVVGASSGREAIDRLSGIARVPDAIVCDHRLRGHETGVDVIAALRVEFNCDIPAVLITGDTSPQRIQSILSTGIPVMNKPLQDHVLMDALLRLINQLPMA